MGESDFRSGVRNLLFNCAGAREGDRILTVGEAGQSTFFEPELAVDFAREANGLGFRASHVLAKPVASAAQFPDEVAQLMAEADVTVFFSRLGDQVRFFPTPGHGTKVMTYTLTRSQLASSMGTTDFNATERVLDRLLEVIAGASRYRICKSDGTDLVSDLQMSGESSDMVPFTLKLFPTMIFPPIQFRNLNGILMVDHFTLSSSTRAYDDSVLMMTSPVRLSIRDGLITEFDGESAMIEALQTLCKRAAEITGGEPFRLNSWHAGINPFTFFDGNPYDDLERWGTVAYGSPRYTHIHAAGHDPGDVAFQLFDASIAFDDEWIWKDGRFVFLDRPNIREMLDKMGQSHITSDILFDIGI